MKKKNYVGKALMFGALLAPIGMPTVSVLADSFYQNQTSAHAADITNWIASTPEQITNNLTTQNINPKQLNGQQYVIQWGDTLWGISQATGISVEKLAYDNNIQNIDLIYAGDVLILNRDGQVPTDYHVTGSGHRCANSKVVINNYYGDHNRFVEKLTFEEPYQAIKFSSKKDCYKYLTTKYKDYTGPGLAKPFIMDNDKWVDMD